MRGLSDLDFTPGLEFQRVVQDRFGCAFNHHHSFSSSGFHMVAFFGRSSIHLNEDSVSLILQSCFGVLAHDFNVIRVSGCCFRFTVQSKDVGFMVYNLKSFQCDSFSIFFWLWGNGGPNWVKEFYLWRMELENE